jgi:hypothetical protein
MSSKLQAQLKDLRDGLLAWHKVLLESERGVYDHDIAKITTTGQFFNLILNDPHFAWLREASALVAQIDEALDAKEPVAEEEGKAFIARARTLITASEEGSRFARAYYDALQRDPNVIFAHREIVRVMTRLAKDEEA